MKLILKLTVLPATLLMILNSCNKTNNELKMIPSNALVVMHVNVKSFGTKLSWSDIQQTGWYKKLYSDSTVKNWTKKLMDNPSGTGIDFDAALIIFMQKAANDNGQLVLEGSVKNAGAFEAFNKNLDVKASMARDRDINTLTLKDQTVVSWNDKKFAYVINSPNLPARMNAEPAILSPDLVQVCKKLFYLKADSSMATTDKFSRLLKEEGDVHVWQNTEAMVSSSTQMGALGMLKLGALLKGNVSTATASFDNGKITVRQKFYSSPELTDVLKKYSGGKINTAMLKNLPSQNIDGFLALNFKPEALKEIIKLTGLDGIINSSMSRQGITLDHFIKANSGDVLFAVTDLMLKKDSFNFNDKALQDTSPPFSVPSLNYLFSVGIGDKASFNKLMAAAKNMGGDLSENLGVYFAGNDKIFAIGNSQQFVLKYVGESKNTFDLISKIGDHPVAFFVDIQKILQSTSSALPVKDSSDKAILNESLKIWENIYSLGGEYKDDAFVMNTEINLVDKNVNSLKQLNNYIDRISKEAIEKKKKYQREWSRRDFSTMDSANIDMDTMPSNP